MALICILDCNSFDYRNIKNLLNSVELIGEECGDSPKQVQRYIFAEY